MDLLDLSLSILSLTILEIILGIDNLVFLSILTEKLPVTERKQARYWGLCFAWITRLMLLASAVWIVHLTEPLLTIQGHSLSARDIFLLSGGAFLIMKATQEIHFEFEEQDADAPPKRSSAKKFKAVVLQVALMDVIFSLDSVLTAIGLTTNFWVMGIAITIAILIMIYASNPVGNFVEKHPTVRMLALSFLILIGTMLVADGLSFHVPRGYLYFAMGFSLTVESLNLLRHDRKKKAKLRKKM
ncbi:MAG: TerC family protein [Legionellaceae bacterium]|nr:TerC family protein [Legionellaceae bacterium]